jgi:hypothetical protein
MTDPREYTVDMPGPTVDASTLSLVRPAAPAPHAVPNGHGGEHREGWLEELRLDDFAVTGLSGARLYPHRGQSVWLSPYGMTLEDQEALEKFNAMSPDDPGEVVEHQYQLLLQVLTRLVVTWNLTDARGQPYPPPTGEGDTAAFMRLPAKLIGHLFSLLKGEPEGNVSGASGASPAG